MQTLRMVPLISCLFLACTLAAAPSPAQRQSGVLMRWDQCWGDAGATLKAFACDTNAGTDLLVGSFSLNAPLSNPVGGFEARIRVTSAAPILPAWWGFMTGGCRTTGLQSFTDPPSGSTQCSSWAGVNPSAVGIAGVIASSNSLQIRVGVSGPTSVALAGEQEYFALALGIRHLKTVGAGSCAGCAVPACIAFENITFEQQPFPIVLTNGANGEASRFVSWQGSTPSDIQTQCTVQAGDRLVCSTTFSCAAAGATNSRGSTWSQVKSLYR